MAENWWQKMAQEVGVAVDAMPPEPPTHEEVCAALEFLYGVPGAELLERHPSPGDVRCAAEEFIYMLRRVYHGLEEGVQTPDRLPDIGEFMDPRTFRARFVTRGQVAP